jgi:hypothetical protein
MYETEFNRWNAKEMGPHRDVVGELKAECEKQGLTFCASNHRAEHYFFMGIGTSFDSDMKPENEGFDLYAPAYYDPEVGARTIEACDIIDEFGATEEYMDDWMVRVCELVINISPKSCILTGGFRISVSSPILKRLPLIITTGRLNGARRLPLILSTMLILSAPQLLILSAALWVRFPVSVADGYRKLGKRSWVTQRITNSKLV